MHRLAEAMRLLAEAAGGDTIAARAQADRSFQEMVSDSAGSGLGFRDGAYFALALAAAGDVDRALSTLERIRRWGLLVSAFFRSPELDVLRDQPRFQRLAEEIGPPR